MRELSNKGIDIKQSGVGAHHHYGAAKIAIKLVVYNTHFMVMHAALHWP